MNITDLKLLFEKIDLDDFKITDEININDFNSCKKILCWLSIVLLFSWMFACFSFFVIFKIKKDFLKNLHIALGCGSVIAIPIVIIFRKYLKKNCLVDG